MLWLENSASTEASLTWDMSVMVPTMSGLTLSSISKRSSCHCSEAKPLVVLFLLFGPQPTWRKVFTISYSIKALAGWQKGKWGHVPLTNACQRTPAHTRGSVGQGSRSRQHNGVPPGRSQGVAQSTSSGYMILSLYYLSL